MVRLIGCLLVFLLVVTVGALAQAQDVKGREKEVSSMRLRSPVFEDNGFIPAKYSLRGGNVNPPLIIENAPDGTKSLVLIVEDPDAPSGTWVHWIMFNIPLTSRIEEDSVPGIEGKNDFGRDDYDGPAPPSGTHRYVFKLYALKTELDLPEGVDKATLMNAMQGYILAEAQLVGLYKK